MYKLCVLVLCLAVNLFLTGIGCNGQSQEQQPKPKPVQTKEEDIGKIIDDYQNKLGDIEKKRLESYMTASESEIWLKNNHYQVQPDRSGYIRITRNYYDPSTGSTDNSRYSLAKGGTIGVGSVSMTVDGEGNVRVRIFDD